MVSTDQGSYGSEQGLAPEQLCDDCLVEKGQYHVLGCDMEECPVCAGQLISCECWCDSDGADL